MSDTYPSGAPMPPYGPSTPEEFVTDGLEWAHEVLLRRDQMNAAVHCGPVRRSPVTSKVAIALSTWRQLRAEETTDHA
jgi:hypothetical protein